MTTLIQMDQNDLRLELKNVLREAINEIKELPIQPTQPDKIDLTEALQHLKANGCRMSKSKAYKLSMDGKLPCIGKFGSRLVFSRKELDAWMHTQTVSIDQADDLMVEHLAHVARKRRV